MADKRTVWGVSTGSYSDYAVDCLFEREEDAKQYIADGHAENIEAFELMPVGYHAKTNRFYVTTLWYGDHFARSGSLSFNVGTPTTRTEDLIDDEGADATKYTEPVIQEHDYRDGGWWIQAKCIDAAKAEAAVRHRAEELGLELRQPETEPKEPSV